MHGLQVTHAATWTNHLTSGLARSMSVPLERKEIKDGVQTLGGNGALYSVLSSWVSILPPKSPLE